MPKAKKSINVKLLRDVAKYISKYPEKYDQDTALEVATCPVHPEAACGTRACIGGWAYFLTTPIKKVTKDDENGVDVLISARKKLGLTQKQADILFAPADGCGWPAKYDQAYNNASTGKARAKVAVAFINETIKTNGANLVPDPVEDTEDAYYG